MYRLMETLYSAVEEITSLVQNLSNMFDTKQNKNPLTVCESHGCKAHVDEDTISPPPANLHPHLAFAPACANVDIHSFWGFFKDFVI